MATADDERLVFTGVARQAQVVHDRQFSPHELVALGPADRDQREAGAVIIGKTHLSEFGGYPVAESATWGVTRNLGPVPHTRGFQWRFGRRGGRRHGARGNGQR